MRGLKRRLEKLEAPVKEIDKLGYDPTLPAIVIGEGERYPDYAGLIIREVYIDFDDIDPDAGKE